MASGDTITVETLTQHASDNPARMILGDPGAESVFGWTSTEKCVERRAGPMDGSIYDRGAGEGFGVHICTGPIAVKGAQPGDVLEVRILDIVPRPSRNPDFAGRVFGSSVAAWWGYHYAEFLSEPKPPEVVTIYKIDMAADDPHACALYSCRWTPQTDPFGVVRRTYDYPGVPVALTVSSAAWASSTAFAPAPPPLRRHRRRAGRGRPRRFRAALLLRRQPRQLAARQRRGRLPSPSRSRGRCFRSATPMRRKATASSAVRPSNV